jgi:CBS domain-containing protein
MKISDIMTPNPECVTPDDNLVEAAKIMEKLDVGFIPVVESRDTRKAIGVLTDRDIAIRAVAQGRDPNEVTVKDVMTEDLVCLGEDEHTDRAHELMEENQLHRVLVCDEQGSVIGVVAMADIARAVDEQRIGHTTKSISQPSGTPTV